MCNFKDWRHTQCGMMATTARALKKKLQIRVSFQDPRRVGEKAITAKVIFSFSFCCEELDLGYVKCAFMRTAQMKTVILWCVGPQIGVGHLGFFLI